MKLGLISDTHNLLRPEVLATLSDSDVLERTDLAEDYRKGRFSVLTLEEYIRVLERCVEAIPADMTIHRLTGDGAKRELIAPLWSADKKHVLREINRAFDRDDVIQGKNSG